MNSNIADLSRRKTDRRKYIDLAKPRRDSVSSFRTRKEIKLSAVGDVPTNRNSAPPGSIPQQLKYQFQLKKNGRYHENTPPQPYRAPSSTDSDQKLREIRGNLQRYSQGSTENLSPTGTDDRRTATERIMRVLSRKMRNESRSGSQPNLSQAIDDVEIMHRPLHASPSIPNLQAPFEKLGLRTGPTLSTVPIALRGSPDGASMRSESPSCESQEINDNIGTELHFQQQPRISGNGTGNHPPPYPRNPPYTGMFNQLPLKLAPSVNVVLRRPAGVHNTKGANNNQRRSCPPPPSYTTHLASTTTNEQRKEIALSGHDWTQRNSDIFNDSEANSRPTSEYDSDYWRGESGPSSDCHSDYGPHNQYGPDYAFGGSVCNLDSLPNYGDIDRGDHSSDYASEASSYYSSIDRRSDHQNHHHPPHDQHPPYGQIPTTYNMSSHHASPATSPNHSTDLAIRKDNIEKKNSNLLNLKFSSIFSSSKHKSHQAGSVNNLHLNHGSSAMDQGAEQESRNFRTIREIQPRAFKFYMEQRVDNLLKAANERFERKRQLELEMQNHNMTEHDRHNMRQLLRKKETNHLRLIRAKLSKGQFDIIKVLGKGAFGEVSLVMKKDTGKYYALKTLNKKEVLLRNQIAHVKAERDILKEADNEWIVKLFYSFQDEECLYFVMEYIPGGDLMSLLIKKGTFPVDLARFYTAELVVAVTSVHDMGFIHRDIKPDNVLIGRDGHIKLTDFGLCTGFRWTHDSDFYKAGSQQTNKLHDRKKHLHRRKEAFSLVGTPNYIAPEVLQACAGGGYTKACDWWSVGIILFEMVIGYAPFYAQTPQQTQERILKWHQQFHIPQEKCPSNRAAELMRSWIVGEDNRLSDPELIKHHPFFNEIDWAKLRLCVPPYVPNITHLEDTSNFDPVEDQPIDDSSHYDPAVAHTLQNHAFLEFTFRRFFDLDGHPQTNPSRHAASRQRNSSTARHRTRNRQ